MQYGVSKKKLWGFRGFVVFNIKGLEQKIEMTMRNKYFLLSIAE
jgi:hypothetical protein